MSPALHIESLCAGYAHTRVLESVNLALAANETLSIIGRNGAGKSTLLKTVAGLATRYSGSIRLHGAPIHERKTYQRVAAGVGYVPQEREIFPSLTVSENLRIARLGQRSEDDIYTLFPPLAERRGHLGNQISGGEQQMLAVGRALIGEPSVLLLDEPSEGLAPIIVEQLFEAFEKLRASSGMTMVLVEQNSHLALEFSPRCLVMDRGAVSYDGDSAALQEDHERLNTLIGVSS